MQTFKKLGLSRRDSRCKDTGAGSKLGSIFEDLLLSSLWGAVGLGTIAWQHTLSLRAQWADKPVKGTCGLPGPAGPAGSAVPLRVGRVGGWPVVDLQPTRLC